VLGALVGGIAGLAKGDDKDDIEIPTTAEQKMVWGAVMVGLAGIVFGSASGALGAGEQWEHVKSPFADFGVGMSPQTDGGFSVTLSRRF